MNARAKSFPPISDLPPLLTATEWTWSSPCRQNELTGLKSEWLLGTDNEGREWLVKMTGSFYAYRERVFATLAQRLAISCQSSVYLVIDNSHPVFQRPGRRVEAYQLGIWLMEPHAGCRCSPSCVCEAVIGKSLRFERIVQVKDAGLAHFHDLVRADVLGHLCGQLEPHGHFFTRNHEYVVIDNECMFHDGPCLNKYSWLNEPGVQPLILDVCRQLVAVSDGELRTISAIPKGYSVCNGVDLFGPLCSAKRAAGEFLDLFGNAE